MGGRMSPCGCLFWKDTSRVGVSLPSIWRLKTTRINEEGNR